MPTNPTAIKAFLNNTAKPPITVRGRTVAELDRVIRQGGGEYRPKLAPRPYQREALAFAVKARRSLMFLKMRLGKTKIALDFAGVTHSAGKWRKGLIIVPYPVTLSVWQEEIPKHCDLTATFVHSTDESVFEEACTDYDTNLVVVAWSSLQWIFTDKRTTTKGRTSRAFAVNHKRLRRFADYFDFACIDEIHMCKNAGTHRFKIAAGLTEMCDLFIGFTGNPHGREPLDGWAQAYLCDRGRTLGSNYYFFLDAMAVKFYPPYMHGGCEYRFDRRKQDVLTKKLESISLSYGWQGNLELPDLTKNIVNLPMTKEQRAQYRDVLREIVESKGESAKVDNAFVRLRQISSGYRVFKDDDGERQVLDLDTCAKLDWLDEFIENIPEDAPVVLFYEFTRTGQKLCDLLRKHKRTQSWLWGGAKDKPAALHAFRSGQVDVLVCNSASGGVGLDLSRADYMVFVECPTSPTIRQQAEARPYGKTGGHIFVDDLACSPVELRVLRAVTEGKALLADIIYKEAREGVYNL